MWLDPLRLAIAGTPIVAFLCVSGWLLCRRRPTVVHGHADLLVVLSAVTGLALIGPLELFRPLAASAFFGKYVWLLLLSCYEMVCLLILLSMQPRIVVYNMPAATARALVDRAAQGLEPSPHWAGNCLALPQAGVSCYLEPSALGGTVSLVAAGADQNLDGWMRLHRSLATLARAESSQLHPLGPLFLLTAGIVQLILVVQLATHPDLVTQAWAELTTQL